MNEYTITICDNDNEILLLENISSSTDKILINFLADNIIFYDYYILKMDGKLCLRVAWAPILGMLFSRSADF